MAKARFTPQWARRIAEDYLEYLVFCYMLGDGCVCLIEFHNRRTYVIFMSPLKLGKENNTDHQIETFVHELIHIFHYVWELEQTESVVCRKAKRFVKHHHNFAAELFEKVVRGNKCQGEVFESSFSEQTTETIGAAYERVQDLIEEKFRIMDSPPLYTQLLLPFPEE